MRRHNFKAAADDDSLPVMVPRNDKAHPEHHDVVSERCQGIEVGWNCVIGKEACHHLL